MWKEDIKRYIEEKYTNFTASDRFIMKYLCIHNLIGFKLHGEDDKLYDDNHVKEVQIFKNVFHELPKNTMILIFIDKTLTKMGYFIGGGGGTKIHLSK